MQKHKKRRRNIKQLNNGAWHDQAFKDIVEKGFIEEQMKGIKKQMELERGMNITRKAECIREEYPKEDYEEHLMD